MFVAKKQFTRHALFCESVRNGFEMPDVNYKKCRQRFITANAYLSLIDNGLDFGFGLFSWILYILPFSRIMITMIADMMTVVICSKGATRVRVCATHSRHHQWHDGNQCPYLHHWVVAGWEAAVVWVEAMTQCSAVDHRHHAAATVSADIRKFVSFNVAKTSKDL